MMGSHQCLSLVLVLITTLIRGVVGAHEHIGGNGISSHDDQLAQQTKNESQQLLGLRMSVSHVLDAHSPFRPAGCDDLCASQLLAAGHHQAAAPLMGAGTANMTHLYRRAKKGRRLLTENMPFAYVTTHFTRRAASPEYYMELSVGSQQHPVYMLIDTGGLLSWIQCKPCNPCHPQALPVFDPSKSSTYKPQVQSDQFCKVVQATGSGDGSSDSDCRYKAMYMDGDSTYGAVAQETFWVGDGANPGLALGYEFGFGCGTSQHFASYTPTSGILGLGFETTLSWPEQLRDKYGYNPAFSFCLAPLFSPPQAGWIAFGAASIPNDGQYFTTKFFQGGALVGDYYLLVQDILLAGINVGIPAGVLDNNPDGTAGVIVDSGTSFTSMVQAAYTPLRTAYINALRPFLGNPDGTPGPLGLDTCWPFPVDISLPRMAFQFMDGSQFELQYSATIFLYYTKMNNRRMCLPYSVLSDDDPESFRMIIGGFSLLRHQIIFDNNAGLFGWKYNVC